jgi:hypothetical protein
MNVIESNQNLNRLGPASSNLLITSAIDSLKNTNLKYNKEVRR